MVVPNQDQDHHLYFCRASNLTITTTWSCVRIYRILEPRGYLRAAWKDCKSTTVIAVDGESDDVSKWIVQQDAGNIIFCTKSNIGVTGNYRGLLLGGYKSDVAVYSGDRQRKNGRYIAVRNPTSYKSESPISYQN